MNSYTIKYNTVHKYLQIVWYPTNLLDEERKYPYYHDDYERVAVNAETQVAPYHEVQEQQKERPVEKHVVPEDDNWRVVKVGNAIQTGYWLIWVMVVAAAVITSFMFLLVIRFSFNLLFWLD